MNRGHRRRIVVVDHAAVPGGQGGHHAGVQRHLHVHVGAVPHARQALAAGLLLHGRPRGLHRGAADAIAGEDPSGPILCVKRWIRIGGSHATKFLLDLNHALNRNDS